MDPCSHLERQAAHTTYSRRAKTRCLIVSAYIIWLCQADIIIYGQTCMYAFLKYIAAIVVTNQSILPAVSWYIVVSISHLQKVYYWFSWRVRQR
jgi:hypothetical protein